MSGRFPKSNPNSKYKHTYKTSQEQGTKKFFNSNQNNQNSMFDSYNKKQARMRPQTTTFYSNFTNEPKGELSEDSKMTHLIYSHDSFAPYRWIDIPVTSTPSYFIVVECSAYHTSFPRHKHAKMTIEKKTYKICQFLELDDAIKIYSRLKNNGAGCNYVEYPFGHKLFFKILPNPYYNSYNNNSSSNSSNNSYEPYSKNNGINKFSTEENQKNKNNIPEDDMEFEPEGLPITPITAPIITKNNELPQIENTICVTNSMSSINSIQSENITQTNGDNGSDKFDYISKKKHVCTFYKGDIVLNEDNNICIIIDFRISSRHSYLKLLTKNNIIKEEKCKKCKILYSKEKECLMDHLEGLVSKLGDEQKKMFNKFNGKLGLKG